MRGSFTSGMPSDYKSYHLVKPCNICEGGCNFGKLQADYLECLRLPKILRRKMSEKEFAYKQSYLKHRHNLTVNGDRQDPSIQ
ncbi:hypothetical protein AYI70_g8475 [Smittium culicis]|uniref:Uncharacterized protein n=1 Tax=Smittium culicis TaxID=133412 RepID=A0A1R1XFU6_9FUNG|nr:hypothetical protein AYI70_g8475 [Smittium culicis]